MESGQGLKYIKILLTKPPIITIYHEETTTKQAPYRDWESGTEKYRTEYHTVEVKT